MAQIHEYPVTVQWSGGRNGAGSAQLEHSGINAPLSVPSEFGGPGAGTNPEELLTTAIAGCYSMTFGIVAAARKLPFVELVTQAVGHVEQNGVSFTYTHVIVRPIITLAADATDDQVKLAEEMAHKADLYCIITNAVRDKVRIEIEPIIRKA